MRRHRVEIYFVMYLSSIIAFLVAASDRDKVIHELSTQNTRIINTFLGSPPVQKESDTLYWYVDAIDKSGRVRFSVLPLKTQVRVYDLEQDDDASLKIGSVRKGFTNTSEGKITILDPIRDERTKTMTFPVEMRFRWTGTYTVSFNLETNRIHALGNGKLKYHNFTFDSSLIPFSRRWEFEHDTLAYVIMVQDTSVPNAPPVEQIGINVARSEVVSVPGYEEENEIFVNLPRLSPVMRVLAGPGRIEKRRGRKGETRYFWVGRVGNEPEQVKVEARVNRGAGGRDIAQAGFRIQPSSAVLQKPLPYAAFYGEKFVADIQVEGLSNVNQYSWEVFLDNKREAAGSGPIVQCNVPGTSDAKTLRVEARYGGKSYPYRLTKTGGQKMSTFIFDIQRPPVHIFFNPPEEVSSTHTFMFYAYRYGANRRENRKPLQGLSEVRVEVEDEYGTVRPIELYSLPDGKYEFVFERPDRFSNDPEPVIITVRAGGRSIQRQVYVYKND